MATLLLTAVGTALGGPVGGALGALAGQAIDNAVLLKPKGREGARLSDLRVQTSSYGSQVPALFGTMRVAGTVIWASDLQETRGKAGGGKGQPKVTTYSYAASFAVALSSRAVRSIGRIWADGNLLRGAAGDFKTALGAFRLYTGDEDQAVDPLIAAVQGMDAPANRGIAYVLFEDLQLADYGNRIPSLTFEVEADAGDAGIDAVARYVSGGAVGADDDGAPLLGGYAASGVDAGEANAGWAALVLTPGQVVSLVDAAGQVPGLWIVETREWEGMAVRLTLRRTGGAGAGLAASAGSAIGAPDRIVGATVVSVVDLPALDETVADRALLYVAAASEGAGWRSAALYRRIGGSGALEPMGVTALPAVMGSVSVPPLPGPREMIDAVAHVDVALLHDAMMLGDCDDAGLARGNNLALVGRELIQFGRATPLGGSAWRLTRLLRGRRGSEWAMARHVVDEEFLLLEADALFAVPDASVTEGEVTVAAIGIADPLPAEASVTVTGEAIMPPAPVHGRWDDDGAGGLWLRWIRRSRAGWRWRDGVDAPLGEEREQYRLVLLDGDMVVREDLCSTAAWHYDAAAQAEDAGAGHDRAGLTLEVRQVGTWAEGRAMVMVGVG